MRKPIFNKKPPVEYTTRVISEKEILDFDNFIDGDELDITVLDPSKKYIIDKMHSWKDDNYYCIMIREITEEVVPTEDYEKKLKAYNTAKEKYEKQYAEWKKKQDEAEQKFRDAQEAKKQREEKKLYLKLKKKYEKE